MLDGNEVRCAEGESGTTYLQSVAGSLWLSFHDQAGSPQLAACLEPEQLRLVREAVALRTPLRVPTATQNYLENRPQGRPQPAYLQLAFARPQEVVFELRCPEGELLLSRRMLAVR